MNYENADLSAQVLALCDRLAADCDRLEFSPPVSCVYNPLVYARGAFKLYLERYLRLRGTLFLLGMNPGPFGMAQTGIPFGDIPSVRDWMGISADIDQPPRLHPKRPIQGFACPRVEGSGKRLWAYFSGLFPDPQDFFARCSVFNYCPLVFMDASGANITPDKLPKAERQALFAVCDQSLLDILRLVRPRALVGIGAFARSHLDTVAGLAGPAFTGLPIVTLTHPSPANPRANQGWGESVEASLAAAGLWPL